MPRSLHNFANWFIDRLDAALPLVVLACVLVGLVGCAPEKPPTAAIGASFVAVGGAQERAGAYVDAAENATQNLKPIVPAAAFPIVTIISDNHHSAQKAIGDATAAASTLQKQVGEEHAVSEKRQSRIDVLEGSWGWRFELTINRIILWTCLAWAAIGITGMALAIFAGGGVAAFGLQLLHFLPLSNIFQFIVNRVKPPTPVTLVINNSTGSANAPIVK